MAMAFPEAACLREQMSEALEGKQIAEVEVLDITKVEGSWRFDSINQPPQVFQQRLTGGVIRGAESVANTVFLPTSTGHTLALGYLSGRVLYHPPGEAQPKRKCLSLLFGDDSQLSVVISMWGLIRALNDKERQQYVAEWYGRGIEPNSKECTWRGFREAVSQVQDPKLSVKKFLHHFEPGHYVSGIDSGYAIEILHRARIHPKRMLASLSLDEQRACYRAVNVVMKEAIRKGGRSSMVDLYGRPGRFVPRACKDTLGKPCVECGTAIEKLKFEGGSSYVCPQCQTV